jgi:hypothetical protein
MRRREFITLVGGAARTRNNLRCSVIGLLGSETANARVGSSISLVKQCSRGA